MTDVPPQNMVNPEIPHFWRTEVLGLATVVFSTTMARVQLARTARETRMETRSCMVSGGTDKQDNADRDHEHPTMSLLWGLLLKKDVGQYGRHDNFYVD